MCQHPSPSSAPAQRASCPQTRETALPLRHDASGAEPIISILLKSRPSDQPASLGPHPFLFPPRGAGNLPPFPAKPFLSFQS